MVISGSEKIRPARQKSYGSFLMCPRLSAGMTTSDDPDHRDDAGFGRREPAGEDAAEQDDRDHQRQRGVPGGEQRPARNGARGLRMPDGPKK